MTVLERIKELGKKRKAAHLAYMAKPSSGLYDAWQVATEELGYAVEPALPHLIAVAEAAKDVVPVLARFDLADGEENKEQALKAALAELTKGAGDER